jgi:hypothetical protein
MNDEKTPSHHDDDVGSLPIEDPGRVKRITAGRPSRALFKKEPMDRVKGIANFTFYTNQMPRGLP